MIPTWADALSEGVILIEEGRVSAINKAALELLDIQAARATVLGMQVIGVLRDHRLEAVYTSGSAAEVELRGRVLRARAIPGGLLLYDLTATRRSQEDARELLAVLSHELRTPVSILRSTLEALSGKVPEELRAKFLARAETEGSRLVRLLEDLTVDVKPPRFRSIVFTEVMARARSLVQRVFEEHGVTLVCKLEASVVWADEDKLLQVLVNLLENAAIHGPDHATVTFVTEIDGAHDRLLIRVQDEGSPLPATAVAQLFEPHTRGNSAKAKGTGLGLYIVRSIAERWGGVAWGVPLEAGNEFGVSVPLRR